MTKLPLAASAALAVLAVEGAAAAQVNLTTDLVSGPSLAYEQDTVRLSVTLLATGGDASAEYAIHLGTGPYRSGATPIGTFGPVALTDGRARTVSVDVPLPSGEVGVRWLVAEVDPRDDVLESNELDNQAVAVEAMTVLDPGARLAVRSVAAGPERLATGDVVQVELELENTGRLPASAPVAVLLSRDPVVTPTDFELGRSTVDVDAGASRPLRLDLSVPAGIGAGEWYVGGIPDPDGVLGPYAGARAASAPNPVTVVLSDVQLLTRNLPDAVLREAYGVRLVASGGDGSYALELSGALPSGLSFDPSNGLLSGVPEAVGTFPLTVTVRSADLTDQVELELVVGPTGEGLGVVTSSLALGFADRPYLQRLIATGGVPPYRWTEVSGALPDGVALTPNGRLQGSPDQLGSYPFEVAVEDQSGDRRTASLVLVVSLIPDVFVTTERVELRVGAPARVALEAIGGRRPLTWTAETPVAPGLELTPDGRLTGTPTEVGRFPFRVAATDATDAGVVGYGFVEVEVDDDGALRITSGPLPVQPALTNFEHVFTAEGGTPPYRWRIAPSETLPLDLVLVPGPERGAEADTGVLYGRARSPGVGAFTVRVEDAVGRIAEQTLAFRAEARAVNTGSGGCGHVRARPSDHSLVLLVLGMMGAFFRARRTGR